MKKVKFLKSTQRNDKGFDEMDEIDFSKGFGEKDADEIFEILSPHS